jgi:hypothetical protein
VTPEEFLPPYLLLLTHFEPRDQDEERRALLQESWWRLVSDWRGDLWGEVCRRWVDTGKWMPKPAELRDLYVPLVARRREEEADAVYQAKLAALPPPEPDGRAARLLRNVTYLRRLARSLTPEE